MLYLRRMLRHLDPSQVIPARVRNALDTLADVVSGAIESFIPDPIAGFLPPIGLPLSP